MDYFIHFSQQPTLHSLSQPMDNNILALKPYQPHPIEQISTKICQILDTQKPESPDHAHEPHIEIQFKYAQIIAFCNSFFEKEQVPPDMRKKVMEVCGRYVMEQNGLHLETLRKLSNFNLVMLNVLGSRVYRLCGGFNEVVHKKFYKIREFLVNLCKQNQQPSSNGLNFYKDVQSIFSNRTFRMSKQSQLRLDVNIKQGQKSGRYSYTVREGWTLTRKQNLVKQDYDLMMAEKTFRLGIKRQEQTPLSFEEVLEAITHPNSQKGGIFLRFKRALRVLKNNEIEIALSQIYQPEQERRNQCISDLKDLLTLDPQNLDEFCQNVFQEFYMWEPKANQFQNIADSISKYEIQSEFTPSGIRKLRELKANKNFRQFDKFIEIALNDLYSLYFVDHFVKKKEINVIGKILKEEYQGEQNFPECRLQNQYGNYMHDLIYQYMTQS